MKRSQINEILLEGRDFFRSFGIHLPPFADWAPSKMQGDYLNISGIVKARLGWDITDYGQGDFDNLGLFLFTLRNGITDNIKTISGKSYAEKIMISRQDQISPMHKHLEKTEDIINKGGAGLAIKMFASDNNGDIDRHSDVIVATDGILRCLKAGDILKLSPGESVTLAPGNWHSFWGEGGDVLIGEVSTLNDDLIDNVFAEPIGRFSNIQEDEKPIHLLVSDYDKWLGNS